MQMEAASFYVNIYQNTHIAALNSCGSIHIVLGIVLVAVTFACVTEA